MEQLAESLDGDTEELLDRWEGRPDYIIEDIFQVRDLETKEIADLDLTHYQRQFVHAYFYGDESTISVLKGRRTGYSFIACACLLLDALRTPHGFFAITAPSKSQAKDRIEDIYDLMEWADFSFGELPVDNRDEIELPNGATMMAFSGNPDTSRGGDSADTLYIDEMDFLHDQEESMRAFSPFVALGDATTVQISTPDSRNSVFMKDQQDGSPEGENGIIAIEQPAFENPQQIDVHESLLEQDVNAAMPYLDLSKAERDRARDPEGFKQEYLCIPVESEYRFFDEDSVLAAVEKSKHRDYAYGSRVGPQKGGKMMMGVDIAGGGKDDTAIVIVEHVGNERYLRYHEAITDATLRSAGIRPAKPRNPSAIAQRIKQLWKANEVDKIITDATNIGEGFDSEIRQSIGRGVASFNFSDSEAVADMMGDLNYAFHNGQMVLAEDETLREQILAIVKSKTKKASRPSFSGKEQSPDGKDDLAIALALAAFPPNVNTDGKTLTQADDTGETRAPKTSQPNLSVSSPDDEDSGYNGVAHRSGQTRGGRGRSSYESRYRRSR